MQTYRHGNSSYEITITVNINKPYKVLNQPINKSKSFYEALTNSLERTKLSKKYILVNIRSIIAVNVRHEFYMKSNRITNRKHLCRNNTRNSPVMFTFYPLLSFCIINNQ